MTNEEFVSQHLADNVQELALRKMPDGIDSAWCMQQIEGWQTAKCKLPSWAAVEGLWFPPRLSMEQCSSEQTALYKQRLAARLLPAESERAKMADFTGGYGVDFCFIAPLFRHSVYVERQESLCGVARHNFPLLGLHNLEVVNASIGIDGALSSVAHGCSLAYLDPARRDGAGRKIVAIEDCTPDLTRLMPWLLDKASFVMLKLSPMLDICQAMRVLPGVREVHVVSVRGECKELLLVCSQREMECRYFCVNLESGNREVAVGAARLHESPVVGSLAEAEYLYEPNPSVLKAGVQDAVANDCGLRKLHVRSNLYVGKSNIDGFPGRSFRINAYSDFGKRNLKALLGNIEQANLTVRNFPSTVAELRRRLKLKEGGQVYLFATTVADGSHVMIRCEKRPDC